MLKKRVLLKYLNKPKMATTRLTATIATLIVKIFMNSKGKSFVLLFVATPRFVLSPDRRNNTIFIF